MASISGLRRRISDRRATTRDLRRGQDVDVSGVRSVGLFLGPYRNLTTLTAAILFLHPHCQVLNHGGQRILGRRRLDFLSRYDDATFDDFVRFAIVASAGGRRGSHGGSITHSHAFGGDHAVRDAFERADAELVKPEIRSVVWKESLLTAAHIRRHRVDLGAIFERNDRLRFLLPVRHPLDTARSNVEKGFAGRFPGLDRDAPVERVLDAVLDELRWFVELQERWPERFFAFFEHSVDRDTFVALARLLDLDPLDEWLDLADEAFAVEGGYEHSPDLVDRYRTGIDQHFTDHPTFRTNLLAFTDPTTPS